MTFPVCLCDGAGLLAPTNLPELNAIAYRIGDFVSFRQAVLTPLMQPATPQPLSLEQSLSVNGVPVWRTDGDGDLAVMIAEWFAYIADIVSFYNERIANEDYLRTAIAPGSVNNLIAILGYRPTPAIGARGQIAALLSPGPTFGGAPINLPQGLQFQSKPTPGLAPQIFELDAATSIATPDQLQVAPTPQLIGSVSIPTQIWTPFHDFEKLALAEAAESFAADFKGYVVTKSAASPAKKRVASKFEADIVLKDGIAPAEASDTLNLESEASLFTGSLLAGELSSGRYLLNTGESTLLLQGAVKSIDPGALLRLRQRDGSSGPWLTNVISTSIGPAPSGVGQQTELTVSFTGTPDDDLTAAETSLESASQTASLWSFFTPTFDDKTVHLSNLQKQIHPGDWVLFTATGDDPPSPQFVEIAAADDVIWDANTTSESAMTGPPFQSTTVTTTDPKTKAKTVTTTSPLPVPHTELALATSLPEAWKDAQGVKVVFGWTSVGTLLDQPYAPWSGSPLTLENIGSTPVPAWAQQAIQLQDSTGIGINAIASQASGGAAFALAAFAQTPPTLQPPFVALPNLLTVSRGKTVQNEVLGSGDQTQAGQDFQLSQSPVTYLQRGASYASTISLRVNGLPWKQVKSFYGQDPDATVFVTREDISGATHVMTGDGVNGARLPTAPNNVVATYRVGAGLASPPAGQLTQIAKLWPGLRAVLNPVAVGGGADPEPANQTRHYAPQSVLTFGRAVSVYDYQAIAAQAPSVVRAQAVWAWDDLGQRTKVKVYVGDTSQAVTAANASLVAASDPNRPVSATLATAIPVALVITLIITPGMDPVAITAGAQTALADPQVGLFGSWNLDVGQRVYRSQIEAASLSVQGAVAILSLAVSTASGTLKGAIFDPGEGNFFTLDPSDIDLTTEADPNG
jgi:hypothetical protein